MKKSHEILQIAESIGQAAIAAEHEAFVKMGIDNSEHVPRVLRLAQAIAGAARSLGLDAEETEAFEASLRSYARGLFLAEWRSQIYEGEDVKQVMLEGERTFDRFSNTRKESQVAAN